MTHRREQAVDVLVVGAGLAGLVAARAIATAGASVHVLEARDRVGGRTLTWRPDATGEERIAGHASGFDLGAAWCWPHQHRVRRLAAELGVDTYAQFRTSDAVYDAGERAAAQKDEIANPLLGNTSGPTAYPWQAHARGLVTHLVLGGVTETVCSALDEVI